MPETIAPSPATSDISLGQFRRLGTVADGGRQAIEIQWNLRPRGEHRGCPLRPRKARGLLTHRQLRCNMTKRWTDGPFWRPRRPWAQNGAECYTSATSSALSGAPLGPSIVQSTSPHADAAARLILVALSLAWGVTWPVMKIALSEIPPFTMRLA